jgi:hypothetical protein
VDDANDPVARAQAPFEGAAVVDVVVVLVDVVVVLDVDVDVVVGAVVVVDRGVVVVDELGGVVVDDVVELDVVVAGDSFVSDEFNARMISTTATATMRMATAHRTGLRMGFLSGGCVGGGVAAGVSPSVAGAACVASVAS